MFYPYYSSSLSYTIIYGNRTSLLSPESIKIFFSIVWFCLNSKLIGRKIANLTKYICILHNVLENDDWLIFFIRRLTK